MLKMAYVSNSNLANELYFQFWTYIQRLITEAASLEVAGWEWHSGQTKRILYFDKGKCANAQCLNSIYTCMKA